MNQTKFLISILFLISLISIAACNRNINPPKETPNSALQAPSIPKQVEPCDPLARISTANASSGSFNIKVSNKPKTIFRELMNQSTDSIQALHKGTLEPEIQQSIVEKLKVLEEIDLSKLQPIMPVSFCSYPLGHSIFGISQPADSIFHAVFKTLIHLEGPFEKVEPMKLEEIIAKVRKEGKNEEGYDAHIQTHFYLGALYKVPNFENRYLFNMYVVAAYDPEFQWNLEEHRLLLDYHESGYLKELLMEMKVVDRKVIDDWKDPTELYWLRSTYDEEKDYIRSFKMREWYFEPKDGTFNDDGAKMRFYTSGWNYSKRLND